MRHAVVKFKEFEFDVYEDGTVVRMARDFVGRWGDIKRTVAKTLPIRISDQGYPCIYYGKGIINLHLLLARAFIGETPEGMKVDHINGNKLDYRLGNLRHVTNSDNGANIASPQKGRGSGHLGVHRNSNGKKWVAWFKHKRLGYFEDKTDAINTVNEARKSHFMSLEKPGFAYGLSAAAV